MPFGNSANSIRSSGNDCLVEICGSREKGTFWTRLNNVLAFTLNEDVGENCNEPSLDNFEQNTMTFKSSNLDD